MKLFYTGQACTRIVLVGILAAFFALTNVRAQHSISRTYTEADGLGSSIVYDVAQDSSGIIWFARRSGISSFDGLTFTNYSMADGLISGTYAFVHVDKKGILWGLPDQGALCVSKFDGKRWKSDCGSRDFDLPFGTNYLSFDVCYPGSDCVWLVGSERKGLFLHKNGVWKQYTTADGLPSNKILAVKGIGQDIFIGSDKGLTIFRNAGTIKDPSFLQMIPSGAIYGIAREGNKIWLLGSNWLGFLEGEKVTIVNRDFVIALNTYWRRCFLYPDGNGNVLFGNPYAVFSYDQKSMQVELIGRKNGLISEGGSAALVDREMNTWITGYRGITKISSKRFVTYSVNDGLFSNEVASAIEIRPGYYVFGHYCALSYYDGSKFSCLILDPLRYRGNYENRILDMDKDGSGNLWLAASVLGVASVDQNRKIHWYDGNNGLKGIAFSVAISPEGKIYAGTSLGLFEQIGTRFTNIKLTKGPQPVIRKIFPVKGNMLFLTTTNNGLIRYKEGEISFFLPKDNPLAGNTYAFHTDREHRSWVGTAAGLYILSDTLLKKVNDPGLCINNPVYLIVEDHEGCLWFGADNGLYRWNGLKLDHFDSRDGLSGLELNRDAGFLDHKNHLWFGTNNGLTVFRPEFDYDLAKIPAPCVKFLFLEVGNDTLIPGQTIALPYDRNNLAFHFQAISFIDERKICYKYRLENFDTAWSKAIPYSNPVIRINNLSPGVYKLQIKACNAIGIWSEPVNFPGIRIKRPFWDQWWFLCLSLIALGAIVFSASRYILIARYTSKLEQMVAIRTAELTESNTAKDNFFSIIAHDLKSPFNVILGMLDLLTRDYEEYAEEEKKSMLLKLKNVSVRTINLLENLLTWARSQKGLLPVVPEQIDLNDLIDENLTLMESAAHIKKIRLFKTGDENLFVKADRNMTHTIIRNLLSNAIKFTYPEGEVEVIVSGKDSEMVEVYVKDNGCGISPQALNKLFKIDSRVTTKGTLNEIGTGLGLILCKDFIEKNNGTIHVISEEGKGSTFYFSLPAWKS